VQTWTYSQNKFLRGLTEFRNFALRGWIRGANSYDCFYGLIYAWRLGLGCGLVCQRARRFDARDQNFTLAVCAIELLLFRAPFRLLRVCSARADTQRSQDGGTSNNEMYRQECKLISVCKPISICEVAVLELRCSCWRHNMYVVFSQT
jgi:hypothetical protein